MTNSIVQLSKEDRQLIISNFRTDSSSLKLALDKAMVSLSQAEQNAISERHRAKMVITISATC